MILKRLKAVWDRTAHGAAPTGFLILAAFLGSGCGVFYTVPTSENGAGQAAVAAEPIEFSAWLVYWDPLSWTDFEANVGRMARVYPEAYSCGADGLPVHLDILKGDELSRTVALAHQHGVKVLGTMNNYANGDFEKTRVQRFLNDSAFMERHVDALLALAKADGLDGLDVDYESLDKGDRGTFTAFVTRLAEKAHAAGLLVGLAAHPKVSEPGTWDGPQAQDYRALGAAVDFLHVMTYDLHWATGSPGSVGPVPWVGEVMRFAATQVPRAKLEMGLNGYGYHWHPRGETLTWPQFLLAQSRYGRAERDDAGGELKLQFKDSEIWMPDAETSRRKMLLAGQLGLRGVAMWVLGQEDPKTWAALDTVNGKK